MKYWLIVIAFGVLQCGCCSVPVFIMDQVEQNHGKLIASPEGKALICWQAKSRASRKIQENIFKEYNFNLKFFREVITNLDDYRSWTFQIDWPSSCMILTHTLCPAEMRVECLRIPREFRFDFLSFEQLRFIIACTALLRCRILDFSYQRFDEMPVSFQCLNELQFLVVRECMLTDYSNLFECLRPLVNLCTLDCSFNQLTVIPRGLENLPNLQQLDLRGNPISELPPMLGRLKRCTDDALYVLESDCS